MSSSTGEAVPGRASVRLPITSRERGTSTSPSRALPALIPGSTVRSFSPSKADWSTRTKRVVPFCISKSSLSAVIARAIARTRTSFPCVPSRARGTLTSSPLVPLVPCVPSERDLIPSKADWSMCTKRLIPRCISACAFCPATRWGSAGDTARGGTGATPSACCGVSPRPFRRASTLSSAIEPHSGARDAPRSSSRGTGVPSRQGFVFSFERHGGRGLRPVGGRHVPPPSDSAVDSTFPRNLRANV